MKLENKKVLVTGADGFIGSHLVEELVRSGCQVRAFVFYNSFNSWGWLEDLDSSTKEAIEIFSGDIRDPHGTRKAVKGCDVIFHLAALIGIPYSYHSPDSYIDTNIKGTLNILQAARDFEVAKIVHTSTSEVYGSAKFIPITEEHPLQGQSPYAATKIGADQIALSFYRSFQLPVAILRPFNTYGPRQSARAIIPTIITQAASGARQIKLGALSPTRDFTYVTDTAKGFIACAQSDETIGNVVNVGSNFEISIRALADMILKLMESDAQIVTDEERVRPGASEVERLYADTTKAKKWMGWQPSYSGIEGLKKGLAKTISWFTERDYLKKYKSEICNI